MQSCNTIIIIHSHQGVLYSLDDSTMAYNSVSLRAGYAYQSFEDFRCQIVPCYYYTKRIYMRILHLIIPALISKPGQNRQLSHSIAVLQQGPQTEKLISSHQLVNYLVNTRVVANLSIPSSENIVKIDQFISCCILQPYSFRPILSLQFCEGVHSDQEVQVV